MLNSNIIPTELSNNTCNCLQPNYVDLVLPKFSFKLFISSFVADFKEQLELQQIAYPSVSLLFDIPHIILGLNTALNECEKQVEDLDNTVFVISSNAIANFMKLKRYESKNLDSTRQNVDKLMKLLSEFTYRGEHIITVEFCKGKNLNLRFGKSFNSFCSEQIESRRKKGNYLKIPPSVLATFDKLIRPVSAFCLLVEKINFDQKKKLSLIDQEYFPEINTDNFELDKNILRKLLSSPVGKSVKRTANNETYQKNRPKYANKMIKKGYEILDKKVIREDAVNLLSDLSLDEKNKFGESTRDARRKKNQQLIDFYNKNANLNTSSYSYVIQNSSLSNNEKHLLLRHYEISKGVFFNSYVNTNTFSDNQSEVTSISCVTNVVASNAPIVTSTQFVELPYDSTNTVAANEQIIKHETISTPFEVEECKNAIADICENNSELKCSVERLITTKLPYNKDIKNFFEEVVPLLEERGYETRNIVKDLLGINNPSKLIKILKSFNELKLSQKSFDWITQQNVNCIMAV